jgi:hypothetical protein
MVRLHYLGATAVFLLMIGTCAKTDLFVDPVHGSDSGDGSSTHPLKTIAKAQSKVRSTTATSPSEAITVHLAAGSTFFVTEPLNFTAADSGMIKWVGEGKGTTVTGAVPLSGWKKSLFATPTLDVATHIAISGIQGQISVSGGASVPPVPPNPIRNIRSGTPGNTAAKASVTTLLEAGAVVTSMVFSYRYCVGYSGGKVGSNFTLRLGSSEVYSSPHLTDYPYSKGSDPDKIYSPPISASADKLNITVQSDGELTVEFEFQNNDHNVQLLLPMTVDLTCAGGSCRKPTPKPTVWSVKAPSGSQSRHLYIKGTRANRTRSPSAFSALVTDEGYNVSDHTFCSKAAAWPNPRTVEFVYPGTAGEWTESRLTVLAVRGGKSNCFVSMAQPGFINFRHKRAQALGSGQPQYIENDGLSPLGVGDFYLDARTNMLSVGAASDENASKNDVSSGVASGSPTGVTMPVAEKLLHAQGLVGVTFRGMHFTEATWLQVQ